VSASPQTASLALAPRTRVTADLPLAAFARWATARMTAAVAARRRPAADHAEMDRLRHTERAMDAARSRAYADAPLFVPLVR